MKKDIVTILGYAGILMLIDKLTGDEVQIVVSVIAATIGHFVVKNVYGK